MHNQVIYTIEVYVTFCIVMLLHHWVVPFLAI